MCAAGPSTALRFASDDRLQRPAKILETVQAFFDHVEASRVAEANGAIVPERSARYDGYIGFAEQPVGEILGG